MNYKEYTQEDIDKIEPYYGDLPDEVWQTLIDMEPELEEMVREKERNNKKKTTDRTR